MILARLGLVAKPENACLTLLVIEAVTRGEERYSRIGPGAARMVTRTGLVFGR